MGSLINENEFRSGMRELIDAGKHIGRMEVVNELLDWMTENPQPPANAISLRLKLQAIRNRNKAE